MMFPLVRQLAEDKIPVTVTCRVLKLCRQQYYRWLDQPFTDEQLDEAWLTNAIFDAHHNDPEFGYRFLADEVRLLCDYTEVSDRVVWRIWRDMGWWSVFGKPKPAQASKPGAASHDDLVWPVFTADAPNVIWLVDITEHWTGDAKLYCCAIKDLFSNRIVGYALDSRMKARLVVAAIEMAVVRRGGDVAGCFLHSDRGSQFRSREVHRASARLRDGRLHGKSRVGWRRRRHGIVLRVPAEKRPQPPPSLGHPRSVADRDRHLDRTGRPQSTPTSTPRPVDPDRVRDHHDPSDSNRCLNPTCHLSARQPLT